MGIFDNLLGNASELSNNDLQTELAPPARGCASCDLFGTVRGSLLLHSQ
jgi:hypothetical protein